MRLASSPLYFFVRFFGRLLMALVYHHIPLRTGAVYTVVVKKGSIKDGLVYHAGFPNAGEDQRFDSLSLDAMVFRHRASTYLWRLDAHGVSELGWQGGVIVVTDRALQPREQDIVVAIVDNEFVVRRWHKGTMILLNGHPETAQEVSLWGVVTHTLAEYRSV